MTSVQHVGKGILQDYSRATITGSTLFVDYRDEPVYVVFSNRGLLCTGNLPFLKSFLLSSLLEISPQKNILFSFFVSHTEIKCICGQCVQSFTLILGSIYGFVC